ncbi:Cys-rich peptide radical SAM maturase CcpM, partial [Clostridium botulinum]|nr:Cys-rich peptide radical SAM maturase CcpM [Clostridium botulinum]
MKQNAFFHLFKTRNCCYIYDVNTNLFLKVPKETYSALENYNGDLEALKDDSVILNLKEKGYLSSNRAEEIEHSLTDALESILDNSLNTLTLQITQECNLRCSYCVYSGSYLNRSHSHKIMSI